MVDDLVLVGSEEAAEEAVSGQLLEAVAEVRDDAEEGAPLAVEEGPEVATVARTDARGADRGVGPRVLLGRE